MTQYRQLIQFDVNKMGSQKNMCEKNVRLGYGLPAKCASAKEDMEYNKKKGWLHPISTLPKDVAVPLFVDTSSPYEHIEVSDHGTVYSDKKKVVNPFAQKFFGWGESVAKARVVEPCKDQPIKVGDSVIVNGRGTGNSQGGGGKTKNFTNQKMKVMRIANSRYGCNQYNKNGAITGWWTASQIKKA